ncbi:MAG: preprotein translocase subunit SecG [Bacteroidales bacterium]|jgi:preprotein translocase subunit SecG|nr:preprotein translocase subunit SecG [Bacteroidales bacterium]
MGAYILVSILILITCALLTLVVLVQNSKGGGLASNFSGSNQFLGVRKTTDFLEKSTWTLAVVLLVLSLFSLFVIPRNQQNAVNAAPTASELEKQQEAAKKVGDYQPAPKQTEAVPLEPEEGE